jgi:uncharacterized membrane protein YuzA (DUF378 family)
LNGPEPFVLPLDDPPLKLSLLKYITFEAGECAILTLVGKKFKKIKQQKSRADGADWAARILVIVGAICLGTLGAFGKNPLQEIFVKLPTLLQAIYTLIGFAGLYELWSLFGKK